MRPRPLFVFAELEVAVHVGQAAPHAHRCKAILEVAYAWWSIFPSGVLPNVGVRRRLMKITVQPPDLSITLTPPPTRSTPGPAPAGWRGSPTTARQRRRVGQHPPGPLPVPVRSVNLAVSTPAGYSCYIEAVGVVDCQTTATTYIAAGARRDHVLRDAPPPARLPVGHRDRDPLDAIPEGDETDNEATATITVQPPDLSATLEASAAEVPPGSSVSWTAVVSNDGPAVARLTTSAIGAALLAARRGHERSLHRPHRLHLHGREGPRRLQPDLDPGLAVGGTLPFTITTNVPASPGTVSVTATADPLNAIPEASETNNAATTSVTVT